MQPSWNLDVFTAAKLPNVAVEKWLELSDNHVLGDLRVGFRTSDSPRYHQNETYRANQKSGSKQRPVSGVRSHLSNLERASPSKYDQTRLNEGHQGVLPSKHGFPFGQGHEIEQNFKAPAAAQTLTFPTAEYSRHETSRKRKRQESRAILGVNTFLSSASHSEEPRGQDAPEELVGRCSSIAAPRRDCPSLEQGYPREMGPVTPDAALDKKLKEVPFARRRRHKTRPDHYKFKTDRRDDDPAKKCVPSRRSNVRRRRGEKTGVVLMHSFSAPNISSDRLTVGFVDAKSSFGVDVSGKLRQQPSTGLFGQGKASSMKKLRHSTCIVMYNNLLSAC